MWRTLISNLTTFPLFLTTTLRCTAIPSPFASQTPQKISSHLSPGQSSTSIAQGRQSRRVALPHHAALLARLSICRAPPPFARSTVPLRIRKCGSSACFLVFSLPPKREPSAGYNGTGRDRAFTRGQAVALLRIRSPSTKRTLCIFPPACYLALLSSSSVTSSDQRTVRGGDKNRGEKGNRANHIGEPEMRRERGASLGGYPLHRSPRRREERNNGSENARSQQVVYVGGAPAVRGRGLLLLSFGHHVELTPQK